MGKNNIMLFINSKNSKPLFSSFMRKRRGNPIKRSQSKKCKYDDILLKYNKNEIDHFENMDDKDKDKNKSKYV